MAVAAGDVIPLSGNLLVDGLTQGSAWTFAGPRIITYSFNLNFNFDPFGNLIVGPGGPWTQPFTDAFVRALATWSNVANVGFQLQQSGSLVPQSSADISAALTGYELSLFGALALGIFPDPELADEILTFIGATRGSYPRPEGDVFFDNDYPGYAHLQDGGEGFELMLHEIGHALGLKHPSDDGANGRPTFAALGIPQYDTPRHTVMGAEPSAGPSASGHIATPMPLDILAIQHIYGANMTYRAGDDVYSVLPDAHGALRTIWDAGGSDTLDASGYTGSGVAIDLRPGIGYAQGAVNPAGYTAIAYNVIIENAVGSALADALIGNEAANVLVGGAGNDTLNGGGGADTMVLAGPRAHYTGSVLGEGILVTDATGADGIDLVYSIERFEFADLGLAFDLGAGEAAGNTVRIIGAAFGTQNIVPAYVGLGINLFDAGVSMLAVCQYALDTPLFVALAGSSSNVDFVDTVYENVVGAAPSDAERAFYMGLLAGSGGTMTQAQLLELAANSPANALNIDLAGLQSTGVEYV